ncbi:MAG: hypothetical protein K2N15_04035 [Lachnospiraceae bacterium]|nr:hypothetical protein [Lachnospiraceae bacterium]
MTKEDIGKIVNAATKECEKNFDKHKIEEYTLANKTTIPFTSRTLHTRKVSDWGTDEDEDEIICYSKDGWEKFNITVQVGAGVQKVISKEITKLSVDDIIGMFEKMELLNKVEFIHKSYAILQLSEYKSDLL